MQMRSRSTRLAVALVAGASLLAGSLMSSTPAGAASPANTAYVTALYRDMLDRTDTTADAGGIDYWANRLEQPGQTRAIVVQNIQRGGKEYYGTIVDFYYLAFLDRTAEPEGRAFYVDRWRSRQLSLEAVTIAIGQSAEYYNRVGATPAAFVDAIFFDIFGREPSVSDQTYYQQVAASQGRGRVVSILVKSAEKRTITVNDQYGTLLGRAPTPAERSAAVTELRTVRREDFDARLLASDEYYSNNNDG